MHRLALALALFALVATTLAAPGQLFALGLGIAAMGLGLVGYTRRAAPGATRLVSAAAFTLGAIGFVLGGLRVVATLAAIAHLEQLVRS